MGALNTARNASKQPDPYEPKYRDRAFDYPYTRDPQMSIVAEKVIPGGLCIGCGACAYLAPDKYTIDYNAFGMLQAFDDKQAQDNDAVDTACPFTSVGKDETSLARELFGETMPGHEYVGKYLQCYIGNVSAGPFREFGSSGGMGKWLLTELLAEGHVDYVVQVAAGDKADLYEYRIFDRAEEIINGSKSAYYPVTLYEALQRIKAQPGTFAVTAVPCFAKMLRNLTDTDEVLKSRIKYVAGIICGHLKSTAFAEALGWQLGVEPDDLAGINFRGKIPNRQANDKGVIATDKNGTLSQMRSSKELFGGNWGYNFFKYKACDYCDDVIAETADIAIGDAWLPAYMKDHKGNSVVVVRNEVLHRIIEAARADGRLDLTPAAPEDVVESQLGGIRHRNEGLAVRLYDSQAVGEWYPEKRVEPSNELNDARKSIYRTRVELRDKSHIAFSEAKRLGDFEHFRNEMNPLIKKLNYKPFPRKVAGFLYRKIKEML